MHAITRTGQKLARHWPLSACVQSSKVVPFDRTYVSLLACMRSKCALRAVHSGALVRIGKASHPGPLVSMLVDGNCLFHALGLLGGRGQERSKGDAGKRGL